MITDFQTTKVYFSSWLPETCPKLWDALHSVLHKMNIDHAFISNTADIWCRDYMPIQVTTDEIVAYKYWPDYLVNKNMHNYITDSDLMSEQIQKEFPSIKIRKINDLVLDGGNVVKCDNTIVMTEKVFEENNDWPKSSIIDKLETAFEHEIMFLPWDRFEKYGHSDGIIHYLGNNRVLLTNYDDFSPAYYKSFRDCIEKRFEVIPLSYPIKEKNKNNWAYINYLQVGNLLMIPQLGIPEDNMAIEQIQKAVPDYIKVIGIPSVEAVSKGGALNCISWNIDANIQEEN